MSDLNFQLRAADGAQIAVYHWPITNPRGVIHVLHGMAEHGGRYARLAGALNQAGWSVVAHDHRGHGLSVGDETERGHYADHDGWQKVLADVGTVQQWVAMQYPGLPRVLAGHSMGSFVALAYALAHAAELDGLVLSSTDLKPHWHYRALRMVLAIEKWRHGARGTSPLIRALSFDSFAKKIAERQTDYDWLSRDPAEVKKYIDDPFCGHDCSMQLWCDMMDGLIAISRKTGLPTLDPELPLFIFAGDNDPMSEFGKGVTLMSSVLRKHRPNHLRIDIHPGGRHELLNDIDRDTVTENLVDWLNSSVQRR